MDATLAVVPVSWSWVFLEVQVSSFLPSFRIKQVLTIYLVFPPIQGAIADAVNTRISYLVPLVGFVYVLGYVIAHWLRTGKHIMRVKNVVGATTNPAIAGAGVTETYYNGEKDTKVEEAELSRSS